MLNSLNTVFLYVATIFSGIFYSADTLAEIYRCKSSERVNSYQEVPCSTGREINTDAPFVRERQQRLIREQKASEEKVKNAEIEKGNLRAHQSKLDGLMLCRSPTGGCTVGSLSFAGISPDELTKYLGSPDSTQKFGSDEIWYFMLWLSDANGEKRLRKVQVTFGYGGNFLTGKTGKVVDKTNIY